MAGSFGRARKRTKGNFSMKDLLARAVACDNQVEII
jgi:hypothetical protein